MPEGLAALQRLGIALDGAPSHPFRGIRFVASGASVEANFPKGNALGMRRTVLHRLLVEHAAEAGVSMLWGTPLTGIDGDRVTTSRGVFRCRWIVGADGGNSVVRRRAGLDDFSRNKRRFAFRRHYRVAPWSDYVEIHWGDGCQVYVTPVSEDEVCAVAMSAGGQLRVDAALARFPQLAARLLPSLATGTERGAVSAGRKLKRVYRGQVVLVGDASGSVDAITGEGMCLAFQQAWLLAEALERQDPRYYQARHRRLSVRPGFMAALMLALENRNRLRHRVIKVLAAKPAIFADLLALHVGALSPVRSALAGLSLGVQLLAA